MFNMLGKIGEVKDRMEEVKKSLDDIILEESELDNAVVVEITAGRKIVSIKTSDEFYSRYSKEEREDILKEAVNNALEKAEHRSKEETQKALKEVMPNIPGMDWNNLPFGV